MKKTNVRVSYSEDFLLGDCRAATKRKRTRKGMGCIQTRTLRPFPGERNKNGIDGFMAA